MKKMSLFRLGIMILAVVFTFSIFGADLAFARAGGGGGRSFSGGSRSSSSSRSSGGFGGGSKSTPAAKPAPAKPAADPAVSKPATTKSTQTNLQSKQSKAAAKAQSAKALESMKAEKAKFTAPASTTATPASTKSAVLGKVGSGNASGSGRLSRNSYYVQRDNYYSGWNRPSYMYNYPSAFGMWDAMFLWMMLDTIGDSNRHNSEMYYHHQNDPAIQEWRKDAEEQAKTNEELKAKLAALDQKVKDMETQGVKPDESFIPTEAGAVVLAAEVAEQNLPEKTAEEIQAEKSGGKFYLIIGVALVTIVIAGFFLFSSRKKSF